MEHFITHAIHDAAPFLKKNMPVLISKERLKKLRRKAPFSWSPFKGYYHAFLVFYLDALLDAYLISYPKSGRTWLRLMLGKVLAARSGSEADDLIDLEEMAAWYPDIPRIRVTHDGAPHLKRPNELETSKPSYKYKDKKVILLVRDPRDVIVSLYFHATKRAAYFQGDISSFIRHEQYGIDTMLRFMNIWYQNHHVPADFLLVRYEDLKTNTYCELKKIITFLELDSVDDTLLKDAIEFTGFDRMRKMEREKSLVSPRMKPGNPNDLESFKVRRGKIGGYVDYLSDQDIAFLNHRLKTELVDFFGYVP